MRPKGAAGNVRNIDSGGSEPEPGKREKSSESIKYLSVLPECFIGLPDPRQTIRTRDTKDPGIHMSSLKTRSDLYICPTALYNSLLHI